MCNVEWCFRQLYSSSIISFNTASITHDQYTNTVIYSQTYIIFILIQGLLGIPLRSDQSGRGYGYGSTASFRRRLGALLLLIAFETANAAQGITQLLATGTNGFNGTIGNNNGSDGAGAGVGTHMDKLTQLLRRVRDAISDETSIDNDRNKLMYSTVL